MGDNPQGVDSVVVYVKVPGDQAGEVNVGEGIEGADRFGGPGEGTRVNIRKPKFGGAGAEAASGGKNIKVEDICRRM